MQFGHILTVRRFKSVVGYYTIEDYVYLADVGDTTYLAFILDEEDGKKALSLSEKNQKFSTKFQFYVVKLSTESLKDRVVLLNNPTDHGVSPKLEDINEELCVEDKRKVKNEICNGSFPQELIDAISDIDLS